MPRCCQERFGFLEFSGALWKALNILGSLGGRRSPGASQSLLVLLFWRVGIFNNPSWCWDLLLQRVPGSLLPSHRRVISARVASY